MGELALELYHGGRFRVVASESRPGVCGGVPQQSMTPNAVYSDRPDLSDRFTIAFAGLSQRGVLLQKGLLVTSTRGLPATKGGWACAA
jgi:hypothetical protein